MVQQRQHGRGRGVSQEHEGPATEAVHEEPAQGNAAAAEQLPAVAPEPSVLALAVEAESTEHEASDGGEQSVGGGPQGHAEPPPAADGAPAGPAGPAGPAAPATPPSGGGSGAGPVRQVPALEGDTPATLLTSYIDGGPTAQAENVGALGGKVDTAAKHQHQAFADAVPTLSGDLHGVDDPGAVPVVAPVTPQIVSDLPLDGAAPALDVAPAPQSDPDLDASGVAAATSGLSDEPSGNAAAIAQALGAIPSGASDIHTELPVPPIPLEGRADPTQAVTASNEAREQSGEALASARQGVLDGPGGEVVQPLAFHDESFIALPDAPDFEDLRSGEGMDDYLGWDLPAQVEGEFDAQQGARMAASLSDAQGQMAQAEDQWESGRAETVAEAQERSAAASAEAQADQVAGVDEARGDIEARRQETMAAQQAAVDDAMGRMDAERTGTLSSIDARITQDQAAITNRYADATAQAEARIADGEAQAARIEANAQKEAEEESWWDQAVGAIESALDSVIEAVSSVWDEIASAVTALLDAAVAFANTVIDAALAFVQEALAVYYAFVKLLIQEILGDVFPGLAQALCEAIDAIQDYVTNTLLPGLAEWLKGAIATIAEWAASALAVLGDLLTMGLQFMKAYVMAYVTGDWSEVADMAIRALLYVCGISYDDFMGTMGQIVEIWDQIVEDPGSLLQNSVDAMVLGFTQFGSNFFDHFIDGAVEWITGATGITMPDNFDLAGIFDITCQILGLTYDKLREKAVEHLGETAVSAIEFVWGYVETFLADGWAGIWEQIQGELAGLFDLVIGQVVTFLIEKAIFVGARMIANYASGVGAIIEAIIAVWQFIRWVIDQINKIWGVVTAVVDSVHDFVFGNIQPAANKIEEALAGVIPIAIDLVAKLLGMGNIGTKVKNVIEGVREMVDNAIDALIEKAISLFRGGDEDSEQAEEEGEGEGGEEGALPSLPFTVDGEDHTIYAEREGERTRIMVASTPAPVVSAVGAGGTFEAVDGDEESNVVRLAREAEQMIEEGWKQVPPDRTRIAAGKQKMEQAKAILATYGGPRTLEDMCPAVGGSALKKWQQLQDETQAGAVALRAGFIAECDARLAADLTLTPLEAMYGVVKEGGTTYICKGDAIDASSIATRGGVIRLIDLESVWKYYIGADKDRWSDAKSFMADVHDGTYDPLPKIAGEIKGAMAQGWWAIGVADHGSWSIRKYKDEFTIDHPKYDWGAVILTYDFATATGGFPLNKPTAFDGITQGNERDPWWEAADGEFGVTRGGQLEGVAPPVDAARATKKELIKGKAPQANNELKVHFESQFSAGLLREQTYYKDAVHKVSAGILRYLETKAEVVGQDATSFVDSELRRLTGMAKQGFYGRITNAIDESGEDFCRQMRGVLAGGGSIPNHMLVHHQFWEHIWGKTDHSQGDYLTGMAKEVVDLIKQRSEEAEHGVEGTPGLETLPVEDWDPVAQGSYRDERYSGPARGRIKEDMRGSSPEKGFHNGPVDRSTGIRERGVEGNQPTPVRLAGELQSGTGLNDHMRGIDLWTLDEANDFIKNARKVLDMPLAAGISGTTTDLLECARSFGVQHGTSEMWKYTLGALGHLGTAGAHSFHEILSSAQNAGVRYVDGDYRSLLTLGLPGAVEALYSQQQYAEVPGIGKPLT